VARRGIRVRDVLKEGALRTKLEERLREANAQIKALGGEKCELEPLMEWALKLGERMRPYVGDASEVLSHEVAKGRAVLFEGAQGTLLDIDHGTYPYVTIFQHGGRQRGGGGGPGADGDPLRHRHHQGVHDAGWATVRCPPSSTTPPARSCAR